MASEALVTFPTDSVVLISMSCLKMARASGFACAWSCAEEPATKRVEASSNIEQTHGLILISCTENSVNAENQCVKSRGLFGEVAAWERDA